MAHPRWQRCASRLLQWSGERVADDWHRLPGVDVALYQLITHPAVASVEATGTVVAGEDPQHELVVACRPAVCHAGIVDSSAGAGAKRAWIRIQPVHLADTRLGPRAASWRSCRADYAERAEFIGRATKLTDGQQDGGVVEVG
jgi:hypothetical protein